MLLVDIYKRLRQLPQRDIHRIPCPAHNALHGLCQHPLPIPHTVLRIGQSIRSLAVDFEAVAGEFERGPDERRFRDVVDSWAHEVREQSVRLQVAAVFGEDGVQERWRWVEGRVMALAPGSGSPL